MLEHANEVLICERRKVDEKTLVLCEDLDMLKETLNMREKCLALIIQSWKVSPCN